MSSVCTRCEIIVISLRNRIPPSSSLSHVVWSYRYDIHNFVPGCIYEVREPSLLHMSTLMLPITMITMEVLANLTSYSNDWNIRLSSKCPNCFFLGGETSRREPEPTILAFRTSVSSLHCPTRPLCFSYAFSQISYGFLHVRNCT